MNTLLTTGEVVEKKVDNSIAFFRLAFRPFFLLGSLFSIISLLLWSLMISGDLKLVLYGGQLWWHMHEMLFGFVAAIIVGFLLTAVQAWTGIASVKGASLAPLVILWLLGRICLFLPTVLPNWFIAIVDLSFLPISAAVLAYPIIKIKLWRNIIFVPLLLVMTYINATMHYAVASQQLASINAAGTSMTLLVTLLICVMGGRVFPMFTANGTQTPRVPAINWLERLAIGSVFLAMLSSFDLLKLSSGIEANIFFIAALAHSVRAFRWRIWVTFKTPLVWSLHLGYWSIPLGLMMYGLAEVTDIVSRSQALHTLTVGAMSVTILAMISRISLGHTGRKIETDKVMSFAFMAIFGAFLVRVFGLYWFESYTQVIFAAVVLWVIAYGCFVIRYLPILSKPRIDGNPG